MSDERVRVYAINREERDPCEAGTVGCCVDHTAEGALDYGCEAW